MSEKKRARRFYRSNLSTIVWNPEKGTELANFSKGHFTTEDPHVAEVLINKGYVEIPLDATEPPEGIIVRQPTHIIEGDVPIMKPSLSEKLVEQTMASKMKPSSPNASNEVTGATDSVVGVVPESKPAKKKSIKKPAAKKTGSSKIRRRKSED